MKDNNKTLIIKLVTTIFLACCFYIPAMFIIGLALLAGAAKTGGIWINYSQTSLAILLSLYLGFTIANKYKAK